jgi:UV DNA damage endonuclease
VKCSLLIFLSRAAIVNRRVFMIRIGYVCINTELPTASKTFRLAGYTEKRMLEVARSNLTALQNILKWNLEHAITLFRITSGLIPFGSSYVNSGSWKTELKAEFAHIGAFARRYAMRFSMHPGQYTVLNSPDLNIYHRAIDDLEYHTAVLDLMELDSSHIIIIHGGGAYGNKGKYLALLKERITELPDHIKKRLALENDEKAYTAEEILSVCMQTGVAGIVDNLHHKVLPSFKGLGNREVIEQFSATWSGRRQKVHYSDQDPEKGNGAHSVSVNIKNFGNYLREIRGLELDIMLEVKDKQNSLLKLRNEFPELH